MAVVYEVESVTRAEGKPVKVCCRVRDAGGYCGWAEFYSPDDAFSGVAAGDLLTITVRKTDKLPEADV